MLEALMRLGLVGVYSAGWLQTNPIASFNERFFGHPVVFNRNDIEEYGTPV